VSGNLVRALSSTFDDHWSQPRLFYNSLTPVEQQFLINAIRFETSHLKSTTVKENVLTQLNKISNDIAIRVAVALGLDAPAPDPTYYHNNKTAGISITNNTLPTIVTLQVGILSTTKALDQATTLKKRLAADGLVVTIVAEALASGVDKPYSAADATDFDAVIITSEAAQAGLFGNSTSTLYPADRPTQIAQNAFLFGKPVGYFGATGTSGETIVGAGFVEGQPGVYYGSDLEPFVAGVEAGLAIFKFTNRFPLDS
jgi:catalase